MSAGDKVLLQNVANNFVSSINNKGGIVTLAGTIFRTNQPINSKASTQIGISALTPNNASTPVSSNDVVISLNEQTYGNIGYVTSVYQGAITIEYLGNVSGDFAKMQDVLGAIERAITSTLNTEV